MKNGRKSRSSENRRACFPGPHQCVLEPVDRPGDPEGDDVLVECDYSLISAGTELAIYARTHTGFGQEDHPFARYPFYPGYAAVGRVMAAGPEAGFSEGDAIFYAGKHARVARVPAKCLALKVGDEERIERAAFCQMATIAATSRWVSTVPPGGVAVIFGLGVVGNLASQLFQLAGFRVIGVDRSRSRCQLAASTGVVETIDAGALDPLEEIRSMTGGKGADVVVEATGSPAAVTPALAAARRLGEVIFLGSTRGTVEVDIYSLIHQKGLTVRGAHAAVIPSESDRTGQSDRTRLAGQMLRMIEREVLTVDPMISRTIRPEEMPEAYPLLLEQKEDVAGILVDWRG